MLAEICDGIHDLRTDSGIHEVVDPAIVNQQAEAALYTGQSTGTRKLFSAIVGITQRVQLPKRYR